MRQFPRREQLVESWERSWRKALKYLGNRPLKLGFTM